MKIALLFFAAALCFVLSSCSRPTALFQPTSRPAAARLNASPATAPTDTFTETITNPLPESSVEATASVLVSRQTIPAEPAAQRIARRTSRVQQLLNVSGKNSYVQPEPRQPKPKKKLRLGNRIRESLGLPLRKELNWWQRISWKLKAAVPIILLAVVFAVLGITILAIIFGVLGAFLLISGLKRSFKVRRPWF